MSVGFLLALLFVLFIACYWLFILFVVCFVCCLLFVICFVCHHCCWRDSRSLKMSVVCLFLVLFSYIRLFICLF